SASKWTREGMATLAALNVLGKIKGYPIWSNPNSVEPFLNENAPPPAACPSIVNSKALGNQLVYGIRKEVQICVNLLNTLWFIIAGLPVSKL
ncbi:hypothetical protein ACUX4R_28240, partial [Salmonella enterica]